MQKVGETIISLQPFCTHCNTIFLASQILVTTFLFHFKNRQICGFDLARFRSTTKQPLRKGWLFCGLIVGLYRRPSISNLGHNPIAFSPANQALALFADKVGISRVEVPRPRESYQTKSNSKHRFRLFSCIEKLIGGIAYQFFILETLFHHFFNVAYLLFYHFINNRFMLIITIVSLFFLTYLKTQRSI